MTEIKMPFLLPEIEGGVLLRWLVKPGDYVEIDQDIAEIQVGEEVMLLPSPLDGQIKEICVAEGELVAMGETLAFLQENGDNGFN